MSEIEEVELSITHAKEIIQKRDMAMKLSNNREFKKLVLEGYFKEEAARLVSISGEENFKDHQDDIFDAIKGISHFRQYMQNIVRRSFWTKCGQSREMTDGRRAEAKRTGA